jgi:hypothetical protein
MIALDHLNLLCPRKPFPNVPRHHSPFHFPFSTYLLRLTTTLRRFFTLSLSASHLSYMSLSSFFDEHLSCCNDFRLIRRDETTMPLLDPPLSVSKRSLEGEGPASGTAGRDKNA